jgi:SecD/SecF fusion protein
MTMVEAMGTPMGWTRVFGVTLMVLGLAWNLAGQSASAQEGEAATATAPAAAEEGTTGTLHDPSPASADETPSALPGFVLLAIVVALFVVPLFLGGYLSRRLRMPDHGWKFALAIGTIAAAIAVLFLGELKFGPDLSGGITLIYELQDTKTTAVDNNAPGNGPGQTNASRRDTVKQLIAALGERVDPSGTKEVTIREYGPDQIEIIIPKASQSELEYIERRIYTAGALEFRITASPIFKENA